MKTPGKFLVVVDDNNNLSGREDLAADGVNGSQQVTPPFRRVRADDHRGMGKLLNHGVES